MEGNYVTNADVKQFLDQTTAILQKETIQEQIQAFEARLRRRELKYVNNTYRCSLPQLSKLRNQLGNLDPNKLKAIMSKQFYNSQVMEAAMCTAESIFYTQNIKTGRVAPNVRIREWIVNLIQIGSESSFGYAIKGDLGKNTSNSFFVVKAPRNPEEEDLIHELFIGLQLNKLRRFIPNFAYVYGGFNCSPPFIFKDKQMAAWCNNDRESIKYVLYENIEGSESVGTLIQRGCDFTQWLNWYLQALYAINLAHRKMDFTHYDLHTDNILVRKTGNVSIGYTTENGTEYINTTSIATLIDYGRAHVKYGNRHYGYWGDLRTSIYPERSFPMHDAYKLLMWSVYLMQYYNSSCLQRIVPIVGFFNQKDTLKSILEYQRSTIFFLPNTTKNNDLKLFDLTRYIRTVIPEANTIITAQPKYSVLSCISDQMCLTGGQVINAIGMRSQLNAQSAFEYYDLASRLNDEQLVKQLQLLRQNFNYQQVKSKDLNSYRQQIEQLKQFMNTFGTGVSIRGANLKILFNDTVLTQVKEFSLKVIRGYDDFQHLILYRDSLVYMANAYNDTNTVNEANRLYDSLNSYWSLLKEYYVIVLNNYRAAQQFLSTNQRAVNIGVRTNPKYLWYWRELKTLVKVFT
jgi:hypothetical protein